MDTEGNRSMDVAPRTSGGVSFTSLTSQGWPQIANEILKAASVFFAAALDRPPSR